MMCMYPRGLFGIPCNDAENRDGALGHPAFIFVVILRMVVMCRFRICLLTPLGADKV